jgi:flagellar protein FliL
MARPTKPKDVKPKAMEPVQDLPPAPRGEASPLMNLVVMALVIVLSTSLSTAAAVYFVMPLVLDQVIGKPPVEGEHEEESEEVEKVLVGPVLEEFTVNLRDPGGSRYLRAQLSISVTAEDPKFEKLQGEALHKWEEAFHAEMTHYKPAIRDIIISALTKRTAEELSTPIGKQHLKEEIQRNVDGLFHGKRRVIRVNLENFIIQ